MTSLIFLLWLALYLISVKLGSSILIYILSIKTKTFWEFPHIFTTSYFSHSSWSPCWAIIWIKFGCACPFLRLHAVEDNICVQYVCFYSNHGIEFVCYFGFYPERPATHRLHCSTFLNVAVYKQQLRVPEPKNYKNMLRYIFDLLPQSVFISFTVTY